MSNVASTMRRLNAYRGDDSSLRSGGNLAGSGSSPTHTRLPLVCCALLSLSAKVFDTPHDTKWPLYLGSIIKGYHENRIAQQNSFWTAIGAAAGEPPRSAAYQHQRPETFLCDCRRLGTLAAAAVPAAQNSLPASVAALPLGPGTQAVRDSTGKSGAHCQYSVFAHRRAGTQRPRLGVGPCAGASPAVRWRQSAVLHVGKRPAGLARGRPPSGSRKRTPLAILAG